MASIGKVVFCGAVDDGKSTLLGRLLFETHSIPEDQIREIPIDENGVLDFSAVTDGLESERSQGITIDVAYRHLTLPHGKRLLIADSPGHEQYTRNMAVAASGADVAVLLIDATRGIREQSIRHAVVCELMGVTRVIVCVNKIDAVDEPRVLFTKIRDEFVAQFKLSESIEICFIPVSGLLGKNVVVADSTLGFGDFPTVLAALEAYFKGLESVNGEEASQDLRLDVQGLLRVEGVRHYFGRISRGKVSVNDVVSVFPSNVSVTMKSISIGGLEVNSAGMGDSISFTLATEIDLSRGDMVIGAASSELPKSRTFLTNLVWIATEPYSPKRSYLLRSGASDAPARIDSIRYVTNYDVGGGETSNEVTTNDVALVELTTDFPIFLDNYSKSRYSGGFILIDRISGETVAAGMAVNTLTRVSEVVRHSFQLSRSDRESLNGIRSGVYWFTGLPGSGKSSIADQVEKVLFENGVRTVVLDGDSIRQTLSEDLGFSPEDRAENVRRVARTAQLMMEAGLIVLVTLVSPYRKDRRAARALFAPADFVEIHVDTPLEECMKRDPKGLYRRALNDVNATMTGVAQPYEEPFEPEIRLDGLASIDNSAKEVVAKIFSRRK